MEKNVTKILRVLAYVYLILGVIGSFVGGIVMMPGRDEFVLFGLMVIIGGALVSVTISALMIGAAVLIDNSRLTKNSGYGGNKAVSYTYKDDSFDTPYDK